MKAIIITVAAAALTATLSSASLRGAGKKMSSTGLLDGCEQYKDCKDCIGDAACGWCSSNATCLSGGVDGPSSGTCAQWHLFNCPAPTLQPPGNYCPGCHYTDGSCSISNCSLGTQAVCALGQCVCGHVTPSGEVKKGPPPAAIIAVAKDVALDDSTTTCDRDTYCGTGDIICKNKQCCGAGGGTSSDEGYCTICCPNGQTPVCPSKGRDCHCE